MSVELARFVVLAVLASGTVVWLLALRAHRRAFRGPDPRRPDLLRAGETEVAAEPQAVRDHVVGTLRSAGLAGAAAVLLTEARDDFVSGELAPPAAPRRPRGLSVRFEVSFFRGGPGTLAEWRILGTPGGGLRIASGLFAWLLAPAALAGAAVLLLGHVVPSEDPQVRLQVVQALQTVHFLWPPFLFAHVRRRLADGVAGSLTTLIRNAAF